MAAAISFYFLLSAIPLTLVVLSVTGMILGSPQEASSFILTLTNLQNLFPDGTMPVGSFFESFVGKAQFVSILSFILLFIFSGGVFLTVESAMNRVFERHEDRPLWRQILFAYILMFLTYFSLMGSAVITWGTMIAADFGTSFLGIPSANVSIFWRWFIFFAPIIWVAFFFTIVYNILPHRKVPWSTALIGGLFAGVAWELAKKIFTFYIQHIVRANELYGGVSVVLATFMWIFYTAAIMLLGGELVMSIIHEKKLRKQLIEI